MGINPAHKGFCTPMSKSTCTGARRRLALTLKKYHGFHKKQIGGEVDQDETPTPAVPAPMKRKSTLPKRMLKKK